MEERRIMGLLLKKNPPLPQLNNTCVSETICFYGRREYFIDRGAETGSLNPVKL